MKEKNDRENNWATKKKKKWESVSNSGKDAKLVPVFKGINNPVDSVEAIYAVKQVLKKLHDSEAQQLVVYIYIKCNSSKTECFVHCIVWNNERIIGATNSHLLLFLQQKQGVFELAVFPLCSCCLVHRKALAGLCAILTCLHLAWQNQPLNTACRSALPMVSRTACWIHHTKFVKWMIS